MSYIISVVVIKALVWDEVNRKHIKKHKISVNEVEDVCRGELKSQSGYQGRIIVLGKTAKGRSLTIVLFRKKAEIYYVVTARDMSKKERRYFLGEKK